MDLYVMKDGVRKGPFLAFRLREMLNDGEISPSDMGWFQGMDGWKPLSEIEALAMWMPGAKPPAAEPPPMPSDEEWQEKVAEALKGAIVATEQGTRRSRATLRYIARLVDAKLFFLVWWVAGWQAGLLDMWDLAGPWHGSAWVALYYLILPGVLWVPAEAAFLHWWGTTPAKWALGMQVCREDGQRLGYAAALKRSALVFASGEGFGLPLRMLLPVVQGMLAWSWFQRTGSTFWDQVSGSQVVHRRPGAAGILMVVMVYAVWMAGSMWVVLRAPFPAGMDPEQRAIIEENRAETNRSLVDVMRDAMPGNAEQKSAE